MYACDKPRLLLSLLATLLALQSIASSPASAQKPEAEPTEDKGEASRSISFLHTEAGARVTRYDDSEKVILIEAEVEQEKVWAVVDTGSEGTVVDSALVRNLGLKPSQIPGQAVAPSGDRITLERVDQVSIKVPDQFVIGGPSLALDLTAISQRIGRPVGLVLGMDVIGNLAMVVNGPRKEIMFVPSGAVKPNASKLVELPLTDGHISGLVAGKPARVGVDLGSASPVTVQRIFCIRILDGCPSTPMGTSVDIAGSVKAIQGVKQVEFSLPGTSGPIDMVIQESTGNADVLIGYPFFQDHFTVFDYAKGKVTVIFR